jgi:hypothetical protein
MDAIEPGIRLAALQRNDGTTASVHRRRLRTETPWWLQARSDAFSMNAHPPREFFIQGVTLEGSTFRPSDWAERLAGAMACFRPQGARGGIGAYIGYSPYCVPRVINSVRCVLVSEALRDIEPMAWDFVMNFARDNHLQTSEACLQPAPGETRSAA